MARDPDRRCEESPPPVLTRRSLAHGAVLVRDERRTLSAMLPRIDGPIVVDEFSDERLN